MVNYRLCSLKRHHANSLPRVSRTVYNHVKDKVALGFAPVGEHRVKNLLEPVTAYRVTGDAGPVAKVLALERLWPC